MKQIVNLLDIAKRCIN